MQRFRYIFGPVPSRRLGLSLGVDMVPHKVCSYDCVYCECGRTTSKTMRRGPYIPYDGVISELEEFISLGVPFHYITFSGSGEPTLNLHMGEVARWIREYVDRPLALLTNSSLFIHPEVRREASLCHLVLPSLDAVDEEVFRRVNRPCEGLRARDVVEALRLFRREYPHVRMALEILFVKGLNDTDEEVRGLKSAVEYIEPHEVHLNTVDRPPADAVEPVDEGFLEQVREFFGDGAVVVGASGYRTSLEQERLMDAVLCTISRRPLRVSDIARLVGEDVRMVAKLVDILKSRGQVEEVVFEGEVFFKGRVA